jgi:hypothetical protein
VLRGLRRPSYARPPLGQLSYNGSVLEVAGDDSYFLVVL